MKRLLTLVFALLLTCSISSVMLGQDAPATTDAKTPDATTAPPKVETDHRKGDHSKARRQRVKTENGAEKRAERTNGDVVERKESKKLKNGKVVTRKQRKHVHQ